MLNSESNFKQHIFEKIQRNILPLLNNAKNGNNMLSVQLYGEELAELITQANNSSEQEKKIIYQSIDYFSLPTKDTLLDLVIRKNSSFQI